MFYVHVSREEGPSETLAPDIETALFLSETPVFVAGVRRRGETAAVVECPDRETAEAVSSILQGVPDFTVRHCSGALRRYTLQIPATLSGISSENLARGLVIQNPGLEEGSLTVVSRTTNNRGKTGSQVVFVDLTPEAVDFVTANGMRLRLVSGYTRLTPVTTGRSSGKGKPKPRPDE